MQNFSSGWPLPLRAWCDTGCRIAEWPKMMLGAELPSTLLPDTCEERAFSN